NQKLPVNNPDEKYERFRKALKRHQNEIRDALGGQALWELAIAFQNLLTDTGNPEKKDDPERPNLKEDFWTMPEVQGLKAEVESFRETVQYGDPLAFDHKFGKGHVVVFLTPAGKGDPSNPWHEWPGGCPASPT